MPKENETTETVEEVDGVPKEFDEAMDTIDADNKADVQDLSEETPPAEETPSEEGVETPEKPEETPVKEELSTDDAEILEGIDRDVLGMIQEDHPDWDDKKIALFARDFPELLDSLKELWDEEQAKIAAKEATSEGQERARVLKEAKELIEENELKFELDPDVVGADVKDAIDKISAVLNQQKKGLSEEQQKLQTERATAYNVRIDTIFDGHAKDFPELGSSEKPDRNSAQLRKDAYAVALALAQVRNVSPEKMISKALTLFKNQGGEKAAEQKVLDKLNKQKKRLTHKPTSRNSTTGIENRKFESEEDRKEAIMEKAYLEAGID